LDEQNIQLLVTQEVKEKLVELGYHPAFGARPLRRILQDQLEDKLADFIIDNQGGHPLQAVLENEEIKIQLLS